MIRFCLAVFLTAISIHAQSVTGSILGLVRDASGAAVPGARISAVNEATNVETTATSASSGDYILP